MVEVEGRRIGGKKKRKRTHRARKKRNKKKTRKKNQQKLQGQDRGRPGIYSPRTILRLSPGSVRLGCQTETSDTEHYPKPNDGFLLTNRNALRICGEEKNH